jgi:predicted secreted protein
MYQVPVARLEDERSGRVAFVSHCLLNENTRYLGGAFRPGAVAEIVDQLVEKGVGICQMPCPEQHAWGGVLKRHMLRAYGSRGRLIYRVRRPLLWLFVRYTRSVYRGLARAVARQVADYDRAGFDVVGIVGVGASPSCGVSTSLDISASFEVMAGLDLERVDRDTFNREAIVACREAGPGLFIAALERELKRRSLAVPLLEHDLVAEMRGEPQQVLPG